MTRLQKLLAAAGLGSRRSIEQWIRDGRITVAGRVAQLGDRAGPTDEILLDGRKLDRTADQSASDPRGVEPQVTNLGDGAHIRLGFVHLALYRTRNARFEEARVL